MTESDDRRLDRKQRSVDLHFRLPAKTYDRLDRHARDQALTVPQWIRIQLCDILRQRDESD